MASGAERATADFVTGDGVAGAGSFRQIMEGAPLAVALLGGERYTVLYANAAFSRLSGLPLDALLGREIGDVLDGADSHTLLARLAQMRAHRSPMPAGILGTFRVGAPPWSCIGWPVAQGGDPELLVLELRDAAPNELSGALQREVAERMVLSALHERDAAASSEASRARVSFLADAGRQLAESLDEGTTRGVISALALPQLGAWCIVDVIEPDGSFRRLAIVHPDPAKEALARALEGRWSPEPDDPFGVAAVVRHAEPQIIADHVNAALAAGAHGAENLKVLRELGFGPLLTVPLVARARLLGAVTFVGTERQQGFRPEDVSLATDLAARSSMALESARLYGEALMLRARAETADHAKSAFLSTMSHELRTPLNAIGGYVELLELGLRGPVTDAQRVDLDRIRRNQHQLLVLISDILNLARIGSGQVAYDIVDVRVCDAVQRAKELIEPLITRKQLAYSGGECDLRLVARADVEKLQQIMLNLLSNAVKFTPAGGSITVDCAAAGQEILVCVSDTGVGIPADRLAGIFEPFVQVKSGLTDRDSGVGLGLAIARDLARAMAGDITVESVLGAGTRFTLRMPRGT